MKDLDQILKIKAVVLYILQHLPSGLDYIHLFKMMYFAQQDHLVTYGLPLMEDTFVARKHGPVPSLTYKVLRGVEGKFEIESSELKDFALSLNVVSKDGHQVVNVAPGCSCDMDELSQSNVKILDKWVAACKDIEAFELSDMSHDKAWQDAIYQSNITGEDVKIAQYSIAEAGGATAGMLDVIRERQSNRQALAWI